MYKSTEQILLIHCGKRCLECNQNIMRDGKRSISVMSFLDIDLKRLDANVSCYV